MKEKTHKFSVLHNKIPHTSSIRGLLLHKTMGKRVGNGISTKPNAVVKLISGISNNRQSLSGPRSSKITDQAWDQTDIRSFNQTAQFEKFYNHFHDKQLTRGKALKVYQGPRSLHFIKSLCQAFPCCM